MRDKPPTRQNKANANKCQFCNKQLPNERALNNHLSTVHSRALKESRLRNVALKEVSKAKKPLQKAKVEARAESTDISDNENIKKSDENALVKSEDIDTAKLDTMEDLKKEKDSQDEEDSEEDNVMNRDSIKTVFKCPECTKTFKVRFLAVKHIQNSHFFNEGDEIESSKDQIEPIQIEQCIKCDQIVTPNKLHSCVCVYYDCLACGVTITGLSSFYGHVEKQHAEGVESFYFPQRTDFLRWKEDVEAQTRYKHLKDNYGSKVIYRCDHSKINNNKKLLIQKVCPSIIVEQSFGDCVHVKYYWIHSHPTLPYKLNDKFKIYSTTAILSKAEDCTSIPITGETAKFLQFRKIIEAVLVSAKQVDDDKLKSLTKLALDMTAILANDKKPTRKEKISDADISKELLVGKRKIEDISNTVSKRTRSKNIEQKNGKSPIILNSLLLAETKISNALEFDSDDDRNGSGGSDIDSLKLHKESGKAQTYTRPGLDMSPSSFNDSYRDFVDKNFCIRSSAQKKKTIVKTKIGQFKPSLSPKRSSLSPKEPKSPRRTRSSGKIDDIDYEVKEQENDCNILILKI